VVIELDARGESMVVVELWRQRQEDLLRHWMKIMLADSAVATLAGPPELA
jgi:hypothetical protein